MEFMGERSLQEQLEIYISYYQNAKLAFDAASKEYFALSDADFSELCPDDIANFEENFDNTKREFQFYASMLASFVVAHKDDISIN